MEPRRSRSRVVTSLFAGTLFVPIACAAIASVLFFVQGGFGGGHGDLDRLILLLGVPSTLLLERLPVPPAVESTDLLLIIWYPALLNSVFFWLPLGCLLSALVLFWQRQHTP